MELGLALVLIPLIVAGALLAATAMITAGVELWRRPRSLRRLAERLDGERLDLARELSSARQRLIEASEALASLEARLDLMDAAVERAGRALRQRRASGQQRSTRGV